LESTLKVRFDSAYITGNFGAVKYKMATEKKQWKKERRITESDLSNIALAAVKSDQDYIPMHIIPLRYDLPEMQNVATPLKQSGISLAAIFGLIYAPTDGMSRIRDTLRGATIMGREYFDPSFLCAQTMRPAKELSMFVDLGADRTTVSIWTIRGPVFLKSLLVGQSALTDALSSGLGISWAQAERIKRENISPDAREMDRFTPACTKHDFSKADVNDILLPVLKDILGQIQDATSTVLEKYKPTKIYITGGGSNIPGIADMIKNIWDIPVDNLGPAAAVGAASSFAWMRMRPHMEKITLRQKRRDKFLSNVEKFIVRMFSKKKKPRFIPIMPSTLAFNMYDMATYARFKSANISMIHVDIMDGLFVPNVAGGIEELKHIRKNTPAHLNVHLMTDMPDTWVDAAAAAGADTITISLEAYGTRQAIDAIRAQKKRAGLAIKPNTPLSELKPFLRDVDEVLIMSVEPGMGGQEFMQSSLARISALAATRDKYKLKFRISVDGGINPEAARACWNAGADFLIVGSYLKQAPDFAGAVQELLNR
jgi:ribulose-phosphate 3-epimerase